MSPQSMPSSTGMSQLGSSFFLFVLVFKTIISVILSFGIRILALEIRCYLIICIFFLLVCLFICLFLAICLILYYYFIFLCFISLRSIFLFWTLSNINIFLFSFFIHIIKNLCKKKEIQFSNLEPKFCYNSYFDK